jgi:hypothetical protein
MAVIPFKLNQLARTGYKHIEIISQASQLSVNLQSSYFLGFDLGC